ncbi:MAG: IS110 family transposase [Alphaproteobacteria bacterium]|uniref:IS110 family transposase n=1 Tax=Candidatus Nitrobium versatile TaxID=2884831 RepID=A0A953M0U8_9BACT|nr:IS110 family transposase [Candidatus Nitrobium versatile]
MRLYAAFDLHSNNSYLGIIDESGKRVFKRKIPNDPAIIKETLEPFKSDIQGIVVESTYNWYFLVDLLREEGYHMHLANPSKIQQYSGMKYSDDKHDAFWLAEMLRLGILPEGYIYPREDRPIRDLLRKRSHLVRLRTSLIVSLQNIVSRNLGGTLRSNDIKVLSADRVTPLFENHEDLAQAGRISKETIDFLTSQIKLIEGTVEEKMQLRKPYDLLMSIPGVGKTLALTIMLETGSIERFKKVGNYASYCRKVSSVWLSNDKKKGKGNKKSGNKYLAWAFSEAAELARRFYPQVRSYYNRKMQQKNAMIAHAACAHKLARAAYHIMKDGVEFIPDKVFG